MDELEKDFVNLFQENGEISGMDRVISAIFALVYLEPGEISLEEVAEKSGYSLSSISVKANMLERMGLVSKSRHPHSKRVYLYMQKDFCKTLRENMLRRHKDKIRLSRERLPQLISKYRHQAKTQRDRGRLAILQSHLEQLSRTDHALDAMIRALGEKY